jgi:hypothetical protein
MVVGFTITYLIIFKEWRVMNNVDRGGVIVLFILYIIYTDFFLVTRLIINTINKVQWVDFKVENVLVSLHSLKTMGLGSIIFKEWP